MRIVNNLPRLIEAKKAQYRAEHNAELTEVRIAVESGVNPATFSAYKNTKGESINWDVWQKLAVYFGVAGHEIFDVLPDEED
jgi:hypothetical protein